MHTTTIRRTIAAPIDAVFDWLVNADNYRAMPGVLHVKTHPADGAEPNGVGALRELTNLAMKATEEVTAFERPHRMSYVIRSSIPPMQHDGATLSFRALDGGHRGDVDDEHSIEAPYGRHLAHPWLSVVARTGHADALPGRRARPCALSYVDCGG